MDEHGFNYFENSRYIDNRIQKKTLIIDKEILTGTDLSETLLEPISINKESEIYLDSFTTFHAKQNNNPDQMAFVLKINEFPLQTISTNQNQNGKIIIPNEEESASSSKKVTVHKGKKLNYICSINPTKITKITGSITDLADTPAAMFNASGRFIAEFSIVSKKD